MDVSVHIHAIDVIDTGREGGVDVFKVKRTADIKYSWFGCAS